MEAGEDCGAKWVALRRKYFQTSVGAGADILMAFTGKLLQRSDVSEACIHWGFLDDILFRPTEVCGVRHTIFPYLAQFCLYFLTKCSF